jgi:hypothetical protein
MTPQGKPLGERTAEELVAMLPTCLMCGKHSVVNLMRVCMHCEKDVPLVLMGRFDCVDKNGHCDNARPNEDHEVCNACKEAEDA